MSNIILLIIIYRKDFLVISVALKSSINSFDIEILFTKYTDVKKLGGSTRSILILYVLSNIY